MVFNFLKGRLSEGTGLASKVVKKLPKLRIKDDHYDIDCDVYLIDVSPMNLRLSKEHSDYRWFRGRDIQKQDLVPRARLLLEFFNNPEKYF